jgi:pilus assembly protein CpaB
MRRVLVVALALVVAIVGGVVTFSYAAGADARAMAGMQPTSVLVVEEAIPAGTASEDVAELVTLAELPANAVVPGSMRSLDGLAGLVTTTDLEPGEQLLTARFAPPDALGGAVEVPAGMHLISVQLEPRRIVGGDVEPGDRVAVFVSEGDEPSPDATRLLMHSVLVVDVAGGTAVVVDETTGTETEEAADSAVTVTVALDPVQSQQLVFSVEYELVYLSIEPDDASDADNGVLRDVIGQ